MKCWRNSVKDFFKGIDGSKTASVLGIGLAGTQVMFNVAKEDIMTDENMNRVILVVSILGTLIGYLVGRLDPKRKLLFEDIEHRIVWLLICSVAFLITWLVTGFRFYAGM